MHVKVLAGKRRPIRRRLFSFFGSGNPPDPGLLWIGWIGYVGNEISPFFDARQHCGDMSVLAVGEPHAVHPFSRELEITDLARFSGISNVIDAYAGFVGNIGGENFFEVRALLIL